MDLFDKMLDEALEYLVFFLKIYGACLIIKAVLL